jgi:hypothetical protein
MRTQLWRHAATMTGVAMFLGITTVPAAARITIRSHEPQDTFFFHATYSQTPFDPSTDFTLEVWNCASGVMPNAGSPPAIVCRDGSGGTTPATVAFRVHVVADSCVDHGGGCYYRNPDFDRAIGGLRYFRVQYARRQHGNRVWLESAGDLSAADQANMLLRISIDGASRPILEDTFVPLPSGGWFSHF